LDARVCFHLVRCGWYVIEAVEAVTAVHEVWTKWIKTGLHICWRAWPVYRYLDRPVACTQRRITCIEVADTRLQLFFSRQTCIDSLNLFSRVRVGVRLLYFQNDIGDEDGRLIVLLLVIGVGEVST
jgi:hypothetical protein